MPTTNTAEIAPTFARACDLAAAAGIPRAVLDGIRCEVGTDERSYAGGHGIEVGTRLRPSYQLDGEDLLEVVLHELGHCVLRAGVHYSSSPRGPIPPPSPEHAPALQAAEVLWCEPWDRTRAHRIAAELTASGELPPYSTHDLLAGWYAAAAAHPRLVSAYAEISPVTPYGATNAEEDFAEAFVLWAARREALAPVAAARLSAWYATAFGGQAVTP
jgi:hypothetical protein